SMEYRSFDEVELPNLTVTEAAPSHRLDFLRFSSDQVARFDARQVEILRAHSPGRTILHNYMGNFHDFDHFKVGANLDVAGWDSYPLGHLDRDGEDEDTKARYRRIGDPDAQAFHHDLYRAVGRGRTWVMEQQPGAVNWAPYNPGPASGALRLWAYEAFAAGAEVVSYFRWRQAPFAQEQMHEGLLLPDASPNHGLRVVTEVSRELERLGATPGAPRADVALVFDYESVWAWRVQPQGADFSHAKIVMAFYRALRRRGIALDVVPPTSEAVAGRKLVLAPALFAWPPGFAGALAASPATVLIGPRSGSKTVDFQIPPNLPPGALGPALDLRVKTVESLPPGERVPVAGGGAFEGWREFVEAGAGADVLDVCQDGAPAFVRRGRLHYLAGRPDADLLTRVVDALLAQAGVAGLDLPRDLRIRDRGDLRYVFNFGPDAIDARDVLTGFDMKMGGTEVPPKGVSIGAARTPRRAG
ncbi:MAG: beta-galactosidase, partial [Hyphomicrobiales bacterium]|nr:beta-galactosidase [Hyphomicrobiales bacterium]